MRLRPALGTKRREGQVDATDLVVGIVLAILVPVLCLAIAGMLGVKGRSAKLDWREEVAVDPPPDRQEVEARFRYAQELYVENAKRFLETAEALRNQPVGDYFRRWATDALRAADSAFMGVESLIQRYRDETSQFQSTLTRAAQFRAELRRDMDRARSLDVLKRDTYR